MLIWLIQLFVTWETKFLGHHSLIKNEEQTAYFDQDDVSKFLFLRMIKSWTGTDFADNLNSNLTI